MLSFGLIGIQLPEKYKENFDVSSEGPSSGGLPKIPLQNTWVKKCTHNAPPPPPPVWLDTNPSSTAGKRHVYAQVSGNGGKYVCRNNGNKYEKSVHYKETAEVIR